MKRETLLFEHKHNGGYKMKCSDVYKLWEKINKVGFAIFRNSDKLLVYNSMSIFNLEHCIDGNGIERIFEKEFDIEGEYTVFIADMQESETQYGKGYGDVYHIEGGAYFSYVLEGEEKELVINSIYQ